jgi:hypothetical protein
MSAGDRNDLDPDDYPGFDPYEDLGSEDSRSIEPGTSVAPHEATTKSEVSNGRTFRRKKGNTMQRLIDEELIWRPEECECGQGQYLAIDVDLYLNGECVTGIIELHRLDEISVACMHITLSEGDPVTFGCLYSPIPGQSNPAFSLIRAAHWYPDNDDFGRKLSRDEALAHPLLDDFWLVVDILVDETPMIRDHVKGELPWPLGLHTHLNAS